jgi:hypothetical protein
LVEKEYVLYHTFILNLKFDPQDSSRPKVKGPDVYQSNYR